MKGKVFSWTIRTIAVLVLAVGTSVLAQAQTPVHFGGIINDYTPTTTVSSAGPWEIRGEWTLKLKGDSGTADFSAVLTMIRSDYWVSQNPSALDNPSARSPHTHHITLVGGVVTPIANGFRVSGAVTVTGNGNPAPFSSTPSNLTVDITGGSIVQFSNVTLTFTGGAAGHFGTQAVHGAVVDSD